MATQPFQAPHGSIQWLNDCIERGKSEEFDERVILTPSLAQALLDRNTNNRPIKEVKVAQLEKDVAEGRWRFNGTTIQIRKDGVLGDGQHRCRAVVRSGISIPTKIGFGLDQDAIDTLDIGAARTPGDIAGMRGVEDPMLSAAIARLLISYEQNGGGGLGKSQNISNTEIQIRLSKDVSITAAARFARGIGRKIPVTGAIAGFCYYHLAKINRAAADEYMGRLASGANLDEGDPALTVREFLSRRAGRGAKATGREKRIEAIFRGWVAHMEDRKLRSLTLNGKFPELV